MKTDDICEWIEAVSECLEKSSFLDRTALKCCHDDKKPQKYQDHNDIDPATKLPRIKYPWIE